MQYLMTFLKTKKSMLFFILLAALLQAFGTLLVPYYVAEIIDKGIAQGSIPLIIRIGLQMLAAAGLTALVSLWGSYLCSDLAAQAGQYLRQQIFEKSQILSIKDFNRFGTASMITRSTGDITVIQQALILMTQLVLPTPLILIAAVIMTAAISPALVFVPLAAMLAFLVLVLFLYQKAKPVSETIQQKVDVVNRIVRESIVGVRVIRAFDNTEYERQRSDDAFTEYADTVIRLNRLFAAFNPLVWGIMGVTISAVVWFGGNLVLEKTILIGAISAVSEYTILMLVFLMMSAMVLVMLPRMTACLHRVQEILDIIPEIKDPPTSAETADITEKIVFDNVSFSYPGAEKPVLEGLSFTCSQGKTTAIIGGTGSGKSTIASLIMRLHDVQEGSVLLEGQDVRKLSQNALRERIGYVPQKAFLFSGTVAENLRMGDPNATDEALLHAAQIAQAAPFLSTLEKGYESPVAQGGTNFSGGQKQRLCIARALVKKAPVYLFDDCFSALDFKTDAALRSALKQELKDATLILIAQRIGTILDADQIIVLDAGRIAGIGKHDTLLQTCSIYKEIADSQRMEAEVTQHE